MKTLDHRLNTHTCRQPRRRVAPDLRSDVDLVAAVLQTSLLMALRGRR